MYNKLKNHIGHAIDCVAYENQNISIECLDCNEVLIDYDNPETEEEN